MYLAIDVGGTKTLVSEVEANGDIQSSNKFKTPATYEAFLETLADTVDSLTTKDFQKACIAMPGKIERSEGVAVSFGNLSWENVPIRRDLEKLIHCPVLVENDANLAGLGEAKLLKQSYKKVLYITVSTGIGSAFIVDGRLSPSTLDAEIGHILLEHDGALRRWEEFASGSAIVEKYGKRASDITDKRTWYVIAHNLATGFLTAIATYTPDIIIIGGGVGTHLPKFQDRLEELLKIYENPLLTIPPIIQAQNPEEAVIYGCYQLIEQDKEATKPR
ncbi:MAG: ROK family protein [Actinobacteria bacterium]|nr:ROK family protein [Actinomycetota bacterium]